MKLSKEFISLLKQGRVKLRAIKYDGELMGWSSYTNKTFSGFIWVYDWVHKNKIIK